MIIINKLIFKNNFSYQNHKFCHQDFKFQMYFESYMSVTRPRLGITYSTQTCVVKPLRTRLAVSQGLQTRAPSSGNVSG